MEEKQLEGKLKMVRESANKAIKEGGRSPSNKERYCNKDSSRFQGRSV